MAEFDLAGFSKKLAALTDELPEDIPEQARAKKARLGILTAVSKLNALLDSLDPIKKPAFVFDPGDPLRIAELIVNTMGAQPKLPLASLGRFWGAGVYAIYYKGDYDAYRPIKGTNHPIYVGKADPKDTHAKTPEGQGAKLCGRLGEHARNIAKAANLRVEDFEYRYLVVQSAWQKAAEDHLIVIYKPIWNNETDICYGLGKHGDAAKTRGNERAPWDMLHPGRKWAEGNPPNSKSVPQIKAAIAEHFRQHPPIK